VTGEDRFGAITPSALPGAAFLIAGAKRPGCHMAPTVTNYLEDFSVTEDFAPLQQENSSGREKPSR
jgi:hypothetical protein